MCKFGHSLTGWLAVFAHLATYKSKYLVMMISVDSGHILLCALLV